MYEISKSIEFDFGHRVWTQDVDPILGCNRPNMCRHLHGHRGKIEITLQGTLTDSGMVTDFSHLAWFKKVVNDDLDHKMILDVNDPLIPSHFHVDLEKNYEFTGNYYRCNDRAKGYLDEVNTGLVLVPFVPTAENFSEMLFRIVEQGLIRFNNFSVKSVKFFETPSSTAIFTPPHYT